MQALAELSNNPTLSTDERSELADTFNRIFANARRDENDPFQPEERKYLVIKLINQLESDVGKLDATDLSRLAWLHMHTNNVGRALELAQSGLELDSENEYCQKLAHRLRR